MVIAHTREGGGSNETLRPGPVLDNDRLLPPGGEALGIDARGNIRTGATAYRHDEIHSSVRPRPLREGAAGCHDSDAETGGQDPCGECDHAHDITSGLHGR